MILDSFKLNGKVALVTGASAGLGASMAVALAEAGANVAAHGNSRTPDSTCELIKRAGRRGLPLRGDLADKTVPQKLIAQTLDEYGQLDILVNNAGLIRRAPAIDYTEEDWATVIEVNLSSVFRLSQLAGREMITKDRGGKIINIASLLSFQGGINVAAYTASKGAVAQLTKALANEGPTPINVNAIAPGSCAQTHCGVASRPESKPKFWTHSRRRWGDRSWPRRSLSFIFRERLSARSRHGCRWRLDGDEMRS